jgi:hypothetical protein
MIKSLMGVSMISMIGSIVKSGESSGKQTKSHQMLSNAVAEADRQS